MVNLAEKSEGVTIGGKGRGEIGKVTGMFADGLPEKNLWSIR